MFEIEWDDLSTSRRCSASRPARDLWEGVHAIPISLAGILLSSLSHSGGFALLAASCDFLSPLPRTMHPLKTLHQPRLRVRSLRCVDGLPLPPSSRHASNGLTA